MKSIARYVCLLGLVLPAGAILPLGSLQAQEQIAWVADVQTASAMAAEQRRLVLLHFYSDNCEPCVRLEQNVFSQPEVAHAVGQNFLAVKVHAGKNPQLAARYRVNRWPTDVFVTPSGLEVYRTISPQKPSEYVAVLNQVALQTGISASRQWQSPLDQIVRPAAAEAGLQAGRAADAMNAMAGQMQQSIAQGQQAAQQAQQQAADFSQRGVAAANQWSHTAASAADRYAQQTQQAQQQLRHEAAQMQGQVEQNNATTRQDLSNAARQAAEQFGQTAHQATQQFQQTAQGFGQQLQPTVASQGYDRRSAFMPQDGPAPHGDLGGAVSPANGSAGASPSHASPSQGAPALVSSPEIPPVPANNPWVTAAQAAPARESASAAPPLVAPAVTANALAAPSTTPPTTAAPAAVAAAAAPQQLIPASQAPPVGLDGFCPVTLLETMARDPNSRSAWKKGDKQFGAIHRGRTYLFTSAEHQQRFLANPDAYAPALAGCDPVRFADRGEMVDGKRAYGLVTPDRRIYLFADEASRNRFEQSPAAYSGAIQQAMLRSEAGSTYR